MTTQDKIIRSPIVRTIAFAFWAIIIFFVTNIVTGVIVAALIIPKDPTATNEALMIHAQIGLNHFFNQYGVILHSAQLVAAALLSFFGLLPWTGKFKRPKKVKAS